MEKPLVLIIDDNEATCTLVTALLQRDFQVETAADGIEGLERIRTRNYGAILLDLRMPHLDGYGVLQYLLENKPDVLRSVIVLTAAISKDEISRVKKYSPCSLLAKPFEIESLLALVRQCATPDAAGAVGGNIFSGGGIILLLADLLRRQLL